MNSTTIETLDSLRTINRLLLRAGLSDAQPDVESDCDRARQHILAAIRKLDPDSTKNPPPEEWDVARFLFEADAAGSMLIQKFFRAPGQTDGHN